MKRLSRFLTTSLSMAVGLALIAGSLVARATNLTPVEAIAQGDQAYAQRFHIEAEAPAAYFEAYRPHIQKAIEDYALAIQDPAVLSIQSQSYVYNRLAQLHYELALVWTADCWGTWLGYNPFEGLVNLSKIREMYERAIRVDETFWEGSAHIGLGALLATSPGFMGGDLDQAKEHFERALQINPSYLTASVVYAESYGFTHSFGNRNGIRDRELIEERLAFAGDTTVGEARPFWDWEAKAEAKLLFSELERFSR